MKSNKLLLQINAEMSEKMHRLAQGVAVDFGAAADKTAKGLGRVYETLDQINARIDLPKEMARKQEELNSALARYCELCEEARRREKARMDSWRSPKSQWNRGPGAGSLYTPGEGGGGNAGKMPNMGGFPRAAMPAMMAIDRMAGGSNDTLRQVTSGIQGIIGLSAAFGPAGAAIGAGFAAIEVACSAYEKSQMKALQALRDMYDEMGKAAEAVQEKHFENLAGQIDRVAASASRAAERFELMAQKQASFAKIREGMDAAMGQTELLGMQRKMSADVSQAAEGDKGRVAAEWNLKIAEKEVELRKRAASVAADNERESLETAEKRVRLAEKSFNDLLAAENKARGEYQRIRDARVASEGKAGERNEFVQKLKSAAEEASRRTEGASRALDKSMADLEVRRKQAEVDAVARSNDVLQAENAAEDARSSLAAERQAAEVAAVKAAAQERDRLDRELHAKRMADLRAEIAAQKEAAAPLQSVASAAQSEFKRAFAMYRDPTRAAAEIEEERDRAADLRRLHKDANRYGGKWRIDDLAALMSAGDSQGVQFRLEEWRKSKSFTPEVESMVRASAAEQTKTTAEDELRKLNEKTGELSAKLDQLAATRDTKLTGIEKNTNQLATKLDELLTVKG